MRQRRHPTAPVILGLILILSGTIAGCIAPQSSPVQPQIIESAPQRTTEQVVSWANETNQTAYIMVDALVILAPYTVYTLEARPEHFERIELSLDWHAGPAVSDELNFSVGPQEGGPGASWNHTQSQGVLNLSVDKDTWRSGALVGTIYSADSVLPASGHIWVDYDLVVKIVQRVPVPSGEDAR